MVLRRLLKCFLWVFQGFSLVSEVVWPPPDALAPSWPSTGVSRSWQPLARASTYQDGYSERLFSGAQINPARNTFSNNACHKLQEGSMGWALRRCQRGPPHIFWMFTFIEDLYIRSLLRNADRGLSAWLRWRFRFQTL